MSHMSCPRYVTQVMPKTCHTCHAQDMPHMSCQCGITMLFNCRINHYICCIYHMFYHFHKNYHFHTSCRFRMCCRLRMCCLYRTCCLSHMRCPYRTRPCSGCTRTLPRCYIGHPRRSSRWNHPASCILIG